LVALQLRDDEFAVVLDSGGDILRAVRSQPARHDALAAWFPGDALARLEAELDRRVTVVMVDRCREGPATGSEADGPWRYADAGPPRVLVLGDARGVVPAAALGNGINDLTYEFAVSLSPLPPIMRPAGEAGRRNQAKEFLIGWTLKVAGGGLTRDGERLPAEPASGFTWSWPATRYCVEARRPLRPARANAPSASSDGAGGSGRD
jgi:hypothetical protein